jgi:tetratricopeptide (TPR) repeat protein
MNTKLWLGFFLYLFLVVNGIASAQNDHFPQFMEKGNRAYNDQKYDLAIDYYQSAIDDKEDCWQAYVGLGNCAFYLKKYKDALNYYEKAYKLNPDNGELSKFVYYLRNKLAVAPTPTPIPRWAPAPLPGLAPLPPLGPVTPLTRP